MHQSAGQTNEQTTLSMPGGKVAGRWDGYAGPVSLGLALRRVLGAPVYAQMGVDTNE